MCDGLLDIGKSIVLITFGSALGIVLPYCAISVRRWIRGPKLSLKKRIDEVSTNVPGIRQAYASVEIENVKPRFARECRAYLLKIEEVAGELATKTVFHGTLQCIWEFDNERDSFDLPKGARPCVNIVMYQEGEKQFSPRVRSHDGRPIPIGPHEHQFQSRGKFRFSGIVTADELEPKPFSLTIDGSNWPPRLVDKV